MNHTVLAFDFGASSGRAIKGKFDGETLTYSEIHRFANGGIEKDGHLCWDFPYILEEVHKAIEKCPDADALAFDTWGVDYGLIDEHGSIIGWPVNYRDGRGKKSMEQDFWPNLP